MTTPEPQGHASHEDDPTGVRALLSSLPDPGPMPPELVERITASLAEEQQERVPTTAPENVAAFHGATEPAAREREAMPGDRTATGAGDRNRLRTVLALAGAAATVLAVATVGVVMTSTGEPTVPSAAQFDATDDAEEGADDEGADDEGADADGGAGQESGDQGSGSLGSDDGASDGQGSEAPAERLESDGENSAQSGTRGGLLTEAPGLDSVHIQMSGTTYTSDGFAQQAAHLLSPTGEPLRSLPVEAAELGPVATPVGLAQCLENLGSQVLDSPEQVNAELASFDGEPAVIVVMTQGAKSQAWAIGRDCTEGAVPVMEGPATP